MALTPPTERVLNAVNLANPNLPAELTTANTTVGVATPMPVAASNGINTLLQLSPIANTGYTDAVTVYYPRVDIAAQFSAADITPTLNLNETPLHSWDDVFTALNQRYNTQLSSVDTPTAPFTLSSQTSLSFTIAPQSYLYTGTLTVALMGFELPEANADWLTQASDSSYPAGVIRITAGSPTPTDVQPDTPTFYGAISPELAGAQFTGDLGTIDGLPEHIAAAFLMFNVSEGDASTTQFQLALLDTATQGNGPEISARVATIYTSTGEVVWTGQISQTGNGMAVPLQSLAVGQEYAIVIAAGDRQFYQPARNWRTGSGAFLFSPNAGHILGGSSSAPVTLMGGDMQTSGPEGTGGLMATFIGNTTGNDLPAFQVARGLIDTFQPSPDTVLDAIFFQNEAPPSSDFPSGIPGRVVVNIMPAPDTFTLPTTLSDIARSTVFDWRTARVIDSTGAIYWQGKLSDVAIDFSLTDEGGLSVAPAFPLPATAGSGITQPMIDDGVSYYALAIDDLPADVSLSTLTNTVLGGLIAPPLPL